MKEYSKGIYVKFRPEEVEILHNRMKVQVAGGVVELFVDYVEQ